MRENFIAERLADERDPYWPGPYPGESPPDPVADLLDARSENAALRELVAEARTAITAYQERFQQHRAGPAVRDTVNAFVAAVDAFEQTYGRLDR